MSLFFWLGMSDLVSSLWLSVCPSCWVNACPWLYYFISANSVSCTVLVWTWWKIFDVWIFFVSAVLMLLIVTHNVISSLTMFLSGLIRLSLLRLLVISTPFLTGLLTVVDRIPLMYLVNHLLLWTVSLTPALQSTSGDISILHSPVILGRGVTVRFLPVLTSS